ncbi:hypothetical protein CYLTODRAFT_418354 [Cylindrobasidium torrendii FP15055 ss-10]|uniref:Uncharacterized protein n=1 Tax=Cylindrobasidium torrendii FP15055 ss-10 TaxID=1314674 RepID=A0A0D7BP34_9AGAR|nr:hypothetical protein CYLTODRAFT_418354 [Cylindrobasidium torrendii FP15055 ss-10]
MAAEAPVSAISLELANFLALVLETLLYGAFCVLFVAAAWVMWTRRHLRAGGVNTRLLITLLVIFILATVHLVLDIIRAVRAYVYIEGGSAMLYYLNLADPLQAAKTAIYVTLTLVADGFVIYRCFVVWNRAWWIVPFPLSLLFGTGVAGFGATYEFSHAAPGAEVFLPDIVPWITSFISMTLATNVVCTSLIAFRVLSIQRSVQGLGAMKVVSASRSAIAVVVESAAVYSASVISLMITYSLGSNAQYTVLDLTSPLIGIAFTFIILRVSLGISSRELTSMVPAPGPSGHSGLTGTSESYSMSRRAGGVAVNVSHIVTIDNDDYSPGKYKNQSGDAASDDYKSHGVEGV